MQENSIHCQLYFVETHLTCTGCTGEGLIVCMSVTKDVAMTMCHVHFKYGRKKLLLFFSGSVYICNFRKEYFHYKRIVQPMVVLKF